MKKSSIVNRKEKRSVLKRHTVVALSGPLPCTFNCGREVDPSGHSRMEIGALHLPLCATCADKSAHALRQFQRMANFAGYWAERMEQYF